MHVPALQDDRRLRRRWELLLLLLAVLLSFACVFLSAWLALLLRPQTLPSANMLPKSHADYGQLSGESAAFAPLRPDLGDEAATDIARLASTPNRPGEGAAVIVRLPPTPTLTVTPTPSPTGQSTSAVIARPSATAGPSPTSLPTATQRPPFTATPTRWPTNTLVPTATASTIPVPTQTPAWIPTSTRVPPTPTRANTDTPPPTDTRAPTSTSSAPDTSTPTWTPTPTDTATPTYTPIPPAPTDTPTPIPGPVVVAMLPHTQVNTGTLTATITGLNFQAGCTATLVSTWTGTVPLSVTSWVPTTTLVVDVPADITAGYYGLTLTNPDSLSYTLASAYTATNPIPAITAIDPAVSIATSSDLAVTISGNNFQNTSEPGTGTLGADLNGIPLTNINFVTTTLEAVVPFSGPGLDLGPYTLTVRNPGPTSPSGQLIDAFSVYTYSTACEPTPTCDLASGDPDGNVVNLAAGAVITIDFGIGNGITDGPGYDMVYYEWPADIDPATPGEQPGILLDMVRIELVDETAPYSSYIVFDWDESSPVDIAGTNVDAYANDSGPYAGEMDNEPIPAADLYPGPSGVPWNTGIAIDIGVAAQASLPDGALFRWVRITSLPGGDGDETQIDAVVRLH